LCSPGRLPLLYHCTGGKDRTGWMTAIVLTRSRAARAGAPRLPAVQTTSTARVTRSSVSTWSRPGSWPTRVLRPVLELGATHLGAAFEEADRRFGSFGRFLGYGLEVSEAMLTGLRRALLGDLGAPEPFR